MKHKKLVGFVLLAFFFGGLQAHACPVCFQSGGEERWAFYATTAFLTFLPLSMVGGVIFWLRKRFKSLEAGPEE